MKIWHGFQKGVDLGGWYSQCVHTEEHYDTFIRDEDFAVIKGWGADHVRVPVDYELLEDERGAYRKSGYDRLKRTIAVCRANGLNMVLDLHKTAGFSFDANEGEAGFFENEAYRERFYRLWENIALHFGGDADIVAFELLNEVTEKEYRDIWNSTAAECIRRIRTAAKNVTILVGGYWHNSAAAVKDIRVPVDEHIVYNFHCYEPLIFTHQGAHWMDTMDRSFRIPVTATFAELDRASKRYLPGDCSRLGEYPPETVLTEKYFEDFMAEAVSAAENAGVPLYCGEYGVIDRADPEDAVIWYRMINAAFRKYGIGRAAWSYRLMDFGIADARYDAVRDELLRCI
ncbi:MAG: cellulase family glycosylhydrolase [Clostridia bacterium]|nr:cellulase family glycosylhydrolase [Clostridia bacterium]